jgi:hypothetical protein
MNPAEMSEDEFLCSGNLVREPDAFVSISAGDMATSILEDTGCQSLREFPVIQVCGDFRIIRLSALDTGLIDNDCNLVGYYIGEGLFIDDDARGRGLSVPLILAALLNRVCPPGAP